MTFRSVLSTIAALGLTACADACPEVRAHGPDVTQGGRAVAIAVRPGADTHLVVASETGGFFRSTDAGATWRHVGGFASHFVHDVAYAPLAPDVLIATTRARFRAENDGGIWRSTDGGATWTQPAGALPVPSVHCPSRPSAYAVSFQPQSRGVWVATDCGVSRSDDDGATWTHVRLDSAVGVRGDSLQHRVWSVEVRTITRGVAAADAGLFHLDLTGVWRRATSGPAKGKPRVFHAFAVSPLSAAHWFHVGEGPGVDRQLWTSVDRGENWTAMDAPLDMNAREPFVRAALSASGDRGFDVYLGAGVRLFRRAFLHDVAGPTPSGDWVRLTADHADPADVAFDGAGRRPVLLATDGGVHRTTDGGKSWKLTGGGAGGFAALQITEVTGQEVTGRSPHLDLYYATQDNDIKASADGGTTWPGSRCCEGFHLRVAATSEDHAGTRFTGIACGGCGTFQSREHLQGQAAWPNAPDGDTIPPNLEFNSAPMLIVEDAYLQPTVHDDAPFDNLYRLTLSAGAAWAPAFTLTGRPRGPLAIGGSLANPTVFQGFRTDATLPQGGFAYGLTRVERVATTPAIARADSVGIGAFGVLKTMFAFYTVYGVDPRDPRRLIAPDVRDGVMRISRDGGRTWQEHPGLTEAVTDGGRFRFAVGDEPLVGVIAFDPYDSCHIVIGTHQRGILRSTDGGTSWKALRGSAQVTYPTSVYFPRRGEPIVSTYGRGLWKLLVRRRDEDGRCEFAARAPRPRPVVLDTAIVLDPATGAPRPFRGLGDTTVCPRCDVVVVARGWITALQTRGDSLVGVAISGGTIARLDRSGREVPLAVANAYLPGEWRAGTQALSARLRPPVRARGLLVEGGRLRGVLASVDELPVALPRVPEIEASGASGGGAPGVVRAGDRVRIVGRGFLPGAPLRVLVGEEVAAEAAAVGADGTFALEAPARGSVGEDVEVVVEQRDGQRLTRLRTSVRIGPLEERDGPG